MAKKYKASPKGTAVYPHLNTPDTKFKKEGERHVKLCCDLSDSKAQELRKAIDSMAAQSLKEATALHTKALADESDPKKLKELKKRKVEACKDLPYSVDMDDNTITFSFKQRASGEDKETKEKWTRGLPIYSASGKPLDEKTTKIGGGSVLQVSYDPELQPFFTYQLGAGVKALRMAGVMVHELKEWSRSAESLGFETAAEDDDTDSPESETGEATEGSSTDETSADDF